jgi:hypothetical protein
MKERRVMSKKWIMGWRRIDTNFPEGADQGTWKFTIDSIEVEKEEKLQPGSLFKEHEVDFLIPTWFPIEILSDDFQKLFSGLELLSEAFPDGWECLHGVLDEITAGAYQAGRHSIMPPDNI